jgi:hypothetical protein
VASQCVVLGGSLDDTLYTMLEVVAGVTFVILQRVTWEFRLASLQDYLQADLQDDVRVFKHCVQ